MSGCMVTMCCSEGLFHMPSSKLIKTGLQLTLIGFSVLLYGLWLYRDAYSAIFLTGKVSRRRIPAGLWHLALVPGMIYQKWNVAVT